MSIHPNTSSAHEYTFNPIMLDVRYKNFREYVCVYAKIKYKNDRHSSDYEKAS